MQDHFIKNVNDLSLHDNSYYESLCEQQHRHYLLSMAIIPHWMQCLLWKNKFVWLFYSLIYLFILHIKKLYIPIRLTITCNFMLTL